MSYGCYGCSIYSLTNTQNQFYEKGIAGSHVVKLAKLVKRCPKEHLAFVAMKAATKAKCFNCLGSV